MANAFEPKATIPLKQKKPPEPASPATPRHDGLSLPAPKPKRKQCSLYLSADMMERVRRIARMEGITIGAVIETCVETALDDLENKDRAGR